jgi:outer membrane protein assembly factor BamB
VSTPVPAPADRTRRLGLKGLGALVLAAVAGPAAAQPLVTAAPAWATTSQRWATGDTRLVPPGTAGEDIVHAGERRIGLLRPGRVEPVWQTAHGLDGPAVYRPRADTRQVIAGGLRSLAAWQLADGRTLWRRQAAVQFGTPCLDRGHLYLGDGATLNALDAGTGERLWQVATTPDTLMSYAPTVTGELVLVGPGDGRLQAVESHDGRLAWRLDLVDQWQYLRQLHVSGNVLVAGSYKELLYGIAVDSGRVLWKFNAGNFINSHHVSGQTAFLWSPTGWIFALDVATGELRWRHRTTAYDGRAGAWASVLAELASDEAHLYALDMAHVLHVLDRHSGDELARLNVGTALRPGLMVQAPSTARPQRQIVLASEAGEIVHLSVST